MSRPREMRPDPQVASLELAWSVERMNEFMAERVIKAVWPGHRLERLKRLYVAYKPGRHCMLSLALWFVDGKRSEPEYVTVTLRQLEKIRRIHRIHFDGIDERAPGGAFILSDLPCLVEVFPADYRVGGLSKAMSLVELDPDPHSGTLRSVPVRDVHVLRYRAHRCGVLRYDLADGGGAIGKVYSKAHVAEQVAQKLERLAPQARERGIAVPGFLGDGGTEGLVLMELLPGDNLADLLETAENLDRAKELVRLAARTLTAFQSMQLEGTRRRTVEVELEQLPDRAEPIRLVAPELHRQIEPLLGRLDSLAQELPAVPDSLVHGDFKASQLLIHEGQVSVVDLDRACPGDPAVDVGNFTATLLKEVLLSDRVKYRPLAETFLEEVARRGDERLIRAARLFVAVALVRMAIRKFERNPGSYARPDSVWPAGRLLREAEHLIDALESQRNARPAEPGGAHG